MKKYKIIGYFILLETPQNVLIQEITIEIENLRLALNSSNLPLENDFKYLMLNKIAYEENNNNTMCYDYGIVIQLEKKLTDEFLIRSVPPRM